MSDLAATNCNDCGCGCDSGCAITVDATMAVDATMDGELPCLAVETAAPHSLDHLPALLLRK